MHFVENEEWNLEDSKTLTIKEKSWLDEMEDNPPIRGFRLLSDIFQRCNVTICEPVDHEEALSDLKWKKIMEEKLYMIEKNNSWEFVDIPPDRKVIRCLELS